MKIKCNHKWEKIPKMFKVVKGDVTHHCKKCGKIIKDWTRNKTGICSSNRCRYRYKYNKKYYDTWRRKHRKQQREYALKRYYEKKSHRKV